MKISILIGTRPETIKLVSVVQELRKMECLETTIWSSGQHPSIVNHTLSLFGLQPDLDLKVFHPDQSLSGTVSRILLGLRTILEREKPDWLLVQGDTSTAVAGALAGFYGKVKLAHLEAGLRSYDREMPFPEEANRRLISVLAGMHFAQDEHARSNLISEGVSQESVFVVGNPGLDLLVRLLKSSRQQTLGDPISDRVNGKRIVLVTVHRRESIGRPLMNICEALRQLATTKRNQLHVLFPVHPNPLVRDTVQRMLGDVDNVSLLDPIDYPDFVRMLERSSVILSDSGGVQEEASFLEKPLLVLRDKTERKLSTCPKLTRIVDSKIDAIVQGTLEFLHEDCQNRVSTVDQKLDEYEMVALRIAALFRSLCE